MVRYAHTNIVARDWEKLSKFYINVFQCEIIPPIRYQKGEWLEKGTGLKGAALEGVHLRLPGYGETGPTLEIYQHQNMDEEVDRLPNKKGIGHIAFEVDDVPLKLAEMLNHGGSTLGEITEKEVVGVGKITFIYARDPEDNLIELQSWEQ